MNHEGPRLRKQKVHKERKCSADWLKWVGFACVLLGTFSSAVLQRGVLHLDTMTAEALYEQIKPGGTMMGMASLAIVTMLFATLAIPIQAKLLYEGWCHTHNQKLYLARLAGLALVSEFLYDWALTGSFVDMSSQNPVWALALCVIMLSILRQTERPGAAGIALKAVVIFASVLWAMLLSIDVGPLLVLLVACFYVLAKRRTLCTLVGTVLSAIQFPASFGMLFVHCYDGGKGKAPRLFFYIAYPVQLLIFGILAALM